MAKVSKETKKCSCCGQELLLTEFYRSQSLANKADKRLPMCKQCVIDIYEDNFLYYKDIEKALYKTLFSLDIYWDVKLSKKCLIETYDTDKHILKAYMSSINLKVYRDKTSRDSEALNIWDVPQDKIETFKLEEMEIDEPIIISKEMVLKWGAGRPEEDYIFLQNEYENMCATYGNKNVYSLSSYEQIALYRLQLRKEWAKDNPNSKIINDINTSISKIAGDCKMKEAQVDNSDEDNMRFSKFIEMIEETEPIPKDKKYDDYDNIHKIWLEDFVKPFAIAQGIESNEEYLEMKRQGRIIKEDKDE